jgi:hypothetical protein
LVEFKVDERLGPGVLDDVVEVFGVVVDEWGGELLVERVVDEEGEEGGVEWVFLMPWWVHLVERGEVIVLAETAVCWWAGEEWWGWVPGDLLYVLGLLSFFCLLIETRLLMVDDMSVPGTSWGVMYCWWRMRSWRAMSGAWAAGVVSSLEDK